MAKIGRKTKRTPESSEQTERSTKRGKRSPEAEDKIIQAISDGLPRDQAAACGGIGRTSLWHWIKDPKFKERVEDAESECLQRCAARVTRNESWQSAAWYLERRMPGDFALTHAITRVLREQYGLLPIPASDSPEHQDSQRAGSSEIEG